MKKKKRKSKKRIAYGLLVVSMVLVALSLFLLFSKPLEVREYDILFTVVEYGGGMDLNTTALTFSLIAPGNAVEREVSVWNTHDFPIEVRVLVSKNIADVINVSSSFIVAPRENVTIPVRVEIPEGFPLGDYAGKIRFEMYKLM